MGKENRGPFGFDELTSTLATASAGSRSDHLTSRTSNFTGVKPPFSSALENWSKTPAFSGVAPSTRFSFCGPGTAASASRYSTPANASGGGNGAACGAAAELSDADVDGAEVSGDASSFALKHPESPSTAAIAGCSRPRLGVGAFSGRQCDERTDWISVIAESCDSFQPP